MTRRTTLAVAATLALTALPACGDRSNDTRAQIEDALHEFLHSALAGDAKGACSRLTAEAREQFAEGVALRGDCEATVREVAAVVSEEEAEAYSELAVRRVRVNGDRAEVADEDLILSASVTSESNDRPTVLRRVDGEWLIEDMG